jgi:type IV fimbrial biogenesis protein FimT
MRLSERKITSTGFTLVELLVTLSVVSILSFIAVPSYRSFVETNRVATATNDLMSDINLARMEAIKRQKGANGTGQAVVCVSTDGSTCSASPTTWNAGWIAFWDDNGDGAYTAGGNDVLLKIHDGLPSTVGVTTTPGTLVALTYTRVGTLAGTTSNMQIRIASTQITKTNSVCLTGGTGRAILAAGGVNCP